MLLTGLVFLMLTAAANSQEISLTGSGAVLSCPGGEGEAVTWGGAGHLQTEQHEATVPAPKGVLTGEFSCSYNRDDKRVRYWFYLDVKVCENCFELSGLMASGVILADLLFTGVVILSVYMCARKNRGSTQQKASRPRAAGAPPVPNPDYERLNQHTLNSTLYAGLK